MATDLRDLRPGLHIDTGSELAEEKLDDLLVHGVDLYNAEAPQVFTVTGRLLDRDANAAEKRAITLFSLLGYLNEQIMPATLNAVVISNVAGRTDLKNLEWSLNKRRDETRKMIDLVLVRVRQAAVVAEVTASELGLTLNVQPIVDAVDC